MDLNLNHHFNEINLGIDSTDYLIPIDCFHMAQVVIVENSHVSGQHICRRKRIFRNLESHTITPS